MISESGEWDTRLCQSRFIAIHQEPVAKGHSPRQPNLNYPHPTGWVIPLPMGDLFHSHWVSYSTSCGWITPLPVGELPHSYWCLSDVLNVSSFLQGVARAAGIWLSKSGCHYRPCYCTGMSCVVPNLCNMVNDIHSHDNTILPLCVCVGWVVTDTCCSISDQFYL